MGKEIRIWIKISAQIILAKEFKFNYTGEVMKFVWALNRVTHGNFQDFS